MTQLSFEDLQAQAKAKGLELTRLRTARGRWRFYLSRGEKRYGGTGSLDMVDRMLACVLSDDDLRAKWRAAGGGFHGPNVETGTMPEHLLLPFLRQLHGTA